MQIEWARDSGLSDGISLLPGWNKHPVNKSPPHKHRTTAINPLVFMRLGPEHKIALSTRSSFESLYFGPCALSTFSQKYEGPFSSAHSITAWPEKHERSIMCVTEGTKPQINIEDLNICPSSSLQSNATSTRTLTSWSTNNRLRRIARAPRSGFTFSHCLKLVLMWEPPMYSQFWEGWDPN